MPLRGCQVIGRVEAGLTNLPELVPHLNALLFVEGRVLQRLSQALLLHVEQGRDGLAGWDAGVRRGSWGLSGWKRGKGDNRARTRLVHDFLPGGLEHGVNV